jgi:hypothetical protein
MREGTKKIATMLNITRTWNSIAALSEMRRAIALARDYAKKRVAFGGHISENTLHIDTMASLQAEFEGAFHLSFWVVDLLGRSERGVASTSEAALLRLLTPITKLTTARQGVWLASEAMECIGGAAYMNDSGFPRILVDMQALPIWEGTTNVLAMDAIRAIKHDDSLSILIETMRRSLRSHQLPALEACSRTGLAAIDALEEWMERSEGDELQAGARRFAMTLGRCAELSRAVEHAAWCDAQGKGDRAAAAARRLAHNGLNLLQHAPLKDSALLA